MSKSRTLSICISDIPKTSFKKHSNGKIYLNLSSYDYDHPNEFGEDFSISLPLTPEQKEARKADPKTPLQRTFCGNGKIWGERAVTEDESMPWDDIEVVDEKTVFDD